MGPRGHPPAKERAMRYFTSSRYPAIAATTTRLDDVADICEPQPPAVRRHRIPNRWVADAWGRGRMGSRTCRRRSIIPRSIDLCATDVHSQHGNNGLQGFDSSRRCKRADGPLCSALSVCRLGARHRLRAKRESPCRRVVTGVRRNCSCRRGAAAHACSPDGARRACHLPGRRESKRFAARSMATRS